MPNPAIKRPICTSTKLLAIKINKYPKTAHANKLSKVNLLPILSRNDPEMI